MLYHYLQSCVGTLSYLSYFPSYSSAACTSILLANIIFLTPFSLLGSSHNFACLPVGLACLWQFGQQFEHIYIARLIFCMLYHYLQSCVGTLSYLSYFPSYSSAACTSILLANIIFLTPFSLLGSSHNFACLPVGLACLRQFGHQFEHIYIARRRRRPHVHFDRLYWVLVRTYVCDTHSFGSTFTYDLGLWLFFIHLALLIIVRTIEVLIFISSTYNLAARLTQERSSGCTCDLCVRSMYIHLAPVLTCASGWYGIFIRLYLWFGCTVNVRTSILLYKLFVCTVNLLLFARLYSWLMRAVDIFIFIRLYLWLGYTGNVKLFIWLYLLFTRTVKFLCSSISTCYIFRNMVTCAVHT